MITQYYKKEGNFRFPLAATLQADLVKVFDCQCTRQCEHCIEVESCESRKAYARLQNLFSEPYDVCMCLGEEHKETCALGEKGKKLRRQLEDRLRKDPMATLFIAKILSI